MSDAEYTVSLLANYWGETKKVDKKEEAVEETAEEATEEVVAEAEEK